MPNPRHRLGRRAEDEVGRWLAAHGWRILAVRHRVQGGECDVVALDPRSTLVAVEVRVRTSARSGDATESVSPRHLRRVGVALLAFAREAEVAHSGLRVDLVALGPGPTQGTWRLRRVPDVGGW